LLLVVLLATGCLPFPATSAPKPAAPAPLVRVAEPATPDVPAPAPDATPEAVAPAPAAEDPATRLETVRQAYGLLLDKFVHPLNPRTLLEAGWSTVETQARRAGPAPVEGPALTGEREADYLAFRRAYLDVIARGGDRLDRQALAFAVVNAMARSVGEGHTFFLDPTFAATRQAQITGGETRVGVGARLVAGREGLILAEVLPDSPAAAAGLQAGDTITAIDGRALAGTAAGRAGLLVGEPGTDLRVTVLRPDGTGAEATLTRAPVPEPAIEARLLPGGAGYIRLRSFPRSYARLPNGRTATEELDSALEAFEAASAPEWVIDLRDNPGGALDGLAALASRFLPDGLILTTLDRNGARSESLLDGHLFRIQRPLVVLVNERSGSSAELFAAAIQEYGRGKVAGARTAGSVNGAEFWSLPDGAGLQITVLEARTGRRGAILEGTGVTPDLPVADTRRAGADYAFGRDPQLEQALAAPAGLSAPPAGAESGLPPRGATLEAAELMRLLRPFGATAGDLPADLRLLGERVYDTPNLYASGAPNALTLRAKVIERGWQGSFRQVFGAADPGTIFVTVALYTGEGGARAALGENDFPNSARAFPAPAVLGEDTIAVHGIGASAGGSGIAWRNGRLVFSVYQRNRPGEESLDLALAVARRLEGRYRANPLR
jgi:carboxyl-terminal processing protease